MQNTWCQELQKDLHLDIVASAFPENLNPFGPRNHYTSSENTYRKLILRVGRLGGLGRLGDSELLVCANSVLEVDVRSCCQNLFSSPALQQSWRKLCCMRWSMHTSSPLQATKTMSEDFVPTIFATTSCFLFSGAAISSFICFLVCCMPHALCLCLLVMCDSDHGPDFQHLMRFINQCSVDDDQVLLTLCLVIFHQYKNVS